jgi:hypothetical protein
MDKVYMVKMFPYFLSTAADGIIFRPDKYLASYPLD